MAVAARIINIGSIAGEIAELMSTYAYGLSKGALHHLTRMLAKEFAARGIAVNAIAPGRFPSKMTKAVLEDHARYQAETRAAYRSIVGATPTIWPGPRSFSRRVRAATRRA